ncbi:MAG: SAM-dependent methyltransferase [Candidatus Lokiarchaeum sp. GC14_75]|nr:MAG: SAM-dependent methyltransferase [Candidatus Lokiarchaeum sp. GC14_75]
MEFFANALEDYYLNTINSKYILYRHCVQKEYNGGKWEVELKNYFRTWDNLWPLERKLINLSYGNILDIGSCTGYYIPYFMEKGTAMGIEISSKINNIAKKRGISNCITGNIFTYKFKRKFDTITLIGNDIALTGTLHRLKKLLKKLSELLNKNGQVLLIIRHIRTLKYWHVVFTPHYNGQIGIPSKLLFLNTYFFSNFVLKYGFRATILGKNESTDYLHYLVRLVKSPR